MEETAERLTLREKIRRARLYCITVSPVPGRTYVGMVEAACRGGADVIQLREKGLSAREMTKLGRELAEVCRREDALLIVNDRLDVALACGADGVHLGQDDLPLPEARQIVRQLYKAHTLPQPAIGFKMSSDGQPPFLIGRSTHSIEQALQAEKEGADYLGCGPIFSTPTKPDYPAVSLDLIGQYRERIGVPFFAIGGIDAENLENVVRAGARRVAVVRAVCGSSDVEGSARNLKGKLPELPHA